MRTFLTAICITIAAQAYANEQRWVQIYVQLRDGEFVQAGLASDRDAGKITRTWSWDSKEECESHLVSLLGKNGTLRRGDSSLVLNEVPKLFYRQCFQVKF